MPVVIGSSIAIPTYARLQVGDSLRLLDLIETGPLWQAGYTALLG